MGLLIQNGNIQFPPTQTIVFIIAAAVKAALLVHVSACIGQMKWTNSPDGTIITLRHLQTLDEASRGPWGSLSLISIIRPRLATAGSILTILALAIDPFAQQIPSFPSRTISDGTNTSFIPRAEKYYSHIIADQRISLSLQHAIVSGIFEQSTEAQPICPSGNCTFPDFVTLGFCGH
jgi:hypothetical protein